MTDLARAPEKRLVLPETAARHIPTPRQPLQVHYDEAMDRLTIEGVVYTGTVFRKMAWPRTGCVYLFERKDDAIDIIECGVLADAEGNHYLGDPPDQTKQ